MPSVYAGKYQGEMRDLSGRALVGAKTELRIAGTVTLAMLYKSPVLIADAVAGDLLANPGMASTGLPAAAGEGKPGIDDGANVTCYASTLDDAGELAEYELWATYRNTVMGPFTLTLVGDSREPPRPGSVTTAMIAGEGLAQAAVAGLPDALAGKQPTIPPGTYVQPPAGTPAGTPVVAGSMVTQDAGDFAGSFGNIQTTVRKLADTGATGDVRILGIGDSTASPMLTRLLPLVQALYPHRTLRTYAWNNSTKVYGEPTTTVVGSGATFIDFYDSGVGGTVFESFMGSQWEAQVAAVQPDLVIVHSGHNYGANPAGGGVATDAVMDQYHLERTKRFVLRIKDACPSADIMLDSQNPYLTAGARDGVSNVRAQAYRSIAAALGCAYGPVLEAFLATGTPASYLDADLLHPTTSGATNGALLGAQALLSQFRISEVAPVSARVSSPLLVPGKQLLTNASMADFAAPPALPGWTAANVTLTKEVGAGLFESKGYSVKMAGVAAASATIYQSLVMPMVRGRVVTLAARVYVPAASSAEAGRINITGNGGLVMVKSGTLSLLKDAWVWVWVTARVPVAATFATVTIYGGNVATDVTYVDRASVVIGDYPRDVP